MSQQQLVDLVDAATGAGTASAIIEALRECEPDVLLQFLHGALDGQDAPDAVATGTPASPGAASGVIATDTDQAMAAADSGQAVILVRPETTPDDVLGMRASRGILTARGGLTSHAAVVARGWGIPAVVGLAELSIDGDTITIGAQTFAAGDMITIDGHTGAVYAGQMAVNITDAPPQVDQLLGWADQVITSAGVAVRVNADTPDDTTQGLRMGAVGIGLCRTEHMFLAPDRLPVMRRFILATDRDTEQAALDELRDLQTRDFADLLNALDGAPITVRLLDPPLHEFLPDLVALEVAAATGDVADDLASVRRLHESNPMLGTRGVRLGLLRHGLYEMQVHALCAAVIEHLDAGRNPRVEIMIPLVSDAAEMQRARALVSGVLAVQSHAGLDAEHVRIGTMIETPRAAVTAAAIARHADFVSFGTNDLTQLTFGLSRDDVEARLLPAYREMGVFGANPFEVLDPDGVGELVRHAVAGARDANPSITTSACGEHAGNPASIATLLHAGVTTVSCSPFRVPLARLAAARTLIEMGRVDESAVTPAPSTTAHTDSVPAASGAAGGGTVVDVDELMVLHVMRLRGFATPDAFIESVGANPDAILAGLVESGYVRFMEARSMYSLTTEGRERHATMLAERRHSAPVDIAGAYERFLELNTAFKDLCTSWQLRNGEQNDHSDADYDAGCIERLGTLNTDARDVIAEMASALPRLGRYVGRLDVAGADVAAGNTNRFTGVMCESFHDIWMELHEDLILLQGIDRAEEGSF